MFIAFIIVFVVGAIALGAGIWIDRTEDDNLVKIIGWIITGIAGVLLLLSSLTIVPANHVGVVTQFGAWEGTLDSGISWVAPWSTVDTFTTRNNRSIRDLADGNDPCVTIKAKGNASGCMDATVLYTIDKSNAEKLWRGWGSFERLNSDLVNRSTDNLINLVTSQYAPSDFPSVRAEMTDKISTEIAKELNPQGVHLESITLGDVHWPENVQNNINSILNADAQVQVAQKNEAAAAAQAKANQARQQSLTPEALVQACLEAAREIKPQYFDCGLGGAQNKPSIILGNR